MVNAPSEDSRNVPSAVAPARNWRVTIRNGMKMSGVSLTAAAAPSRTPRGTVHERTPMTQVRSSRTIRAMTKLTCPKPNVVRSGLSRRAGNKTITAVAQIR